MIEFRQNTNNMSARFCVQCGSQLAPGGECSRCAPPSGVLCGSCGFANTPGSRFCAGCGNAMSDGRRAFGVARPAIATGQASIPEGASERREVTVLFVDALNFTATSRQLDSEDVYTFIDEAMKLLADVVKDFEGTIDKFTGDGLMAIFGAPVMHEDDAERAVRTAWEMQRIVEPFRKRLHAQHGFDFRIRIGVHTGEVVAGRIGSANVHSEYTVIGDTVNLASRLQAAAEPDTVVVSGTTYDRTCKNIRYEPLPPLTLKGIPDPVKAYKVAGLRPYAGPQRGLPGVQVPMVGRDVALRALFEADERANKNGLQIVCISGEAGVGKTRLVQEFILGVDEAKAQVITVRCTAINSSRPLAVAADLLRAIMGMQETDRPEAQVEALRASMAAYELGNEFAPYLASLLGIVDDDTGWHRALASLDESMLQEQTHVAFRAAIIAVARSKKLVVIVDDVHWIDTASCELLHYILQSQPEHAILFVLATRHAERDHLHEELLDGVSTDPDHFDEITLEPLNNSDTKTLVRSLLPGDSLAAHSLRQKIVARSGGNPLYAEELVHMLMERGGVTRLPDDTWQINTGAEALLADLPSGLRGLILTRADALPLQLRLLVQRASVLGRSFPVRLLQQLIEDPELDVAAGLEDLVDREFLVAEAMGLERGYAFRHALIQEAVHSTLLKRDRQELHRRVAEVLEEGRFSTGIDRNEVLGFHWAESAEPARAIPYLIAAAEYSARRHATEAAAERCRRALAILATSPDEYALVQVNLILGRSLKFLGRLGEAKEAIIAAQDALFRQLATEEASASRVATYGEVLRELAEIKGREGLLDEAFMHLEEASLALAEWQDPRTRALRTSLIERMAWVRFRQGKLEEALMRADDLMREIGSDPDCDPVTLANVYNHLAGVLWRYGKCEAAVPYVRKSLGLYHKIGYLFGKATAHMNLGVLLYTLGKWDEAATNFERSEWIRREIGLMVGRASNLFNLAVLRISSGDHKRAKAELETAYSIAEQLGEERERVHALGELARLALIQRKAQEAAEYLERLKGHEGSLDNDERVQIQWMNALVEADRSIERAIEIAEEGCRVARTGGFAASEADCSRVLAILHARKGDRSHAQATFKHSLELSRKLADPYREALTLLEFGTTAPTGNEKVMVEEALRLFTQLGAAHDAQRATAALRQFGFETNAQGKGQQ